MRASPDTVAKVHRWPARGRVDFVISLSELWFPLDRTVSLGDNSSLIGSI